MPTTGSLRDRTPPRGRRAELGGVAAGAVAVLLLSMTLFWQGELARWSFPALSAWSLVATVTAYVHLLLRTARGFWSISCIFLLVAIIFHQGLLLYSAFAIPAPFEGTTGSWFGTAATSKAVVAATIGLTAFGIMSGLLSSRRIESREVESLDSQKSAFGAAGFAVLALAVLVWGFIAVTSRGLLFFLSSYQQWLAASDGRQVGLAYYGIGLGLVLTVASGSIKWRRRSLAVFAVFAVAALPMGLRGEVLFPAAAGAAMYARHWKPPRLLSAVLLMVIALTGINALQQVRQVGIGGVSATEITASPLQGVAELGSSLRVVDVVIGWHELGGDKSLRDGSTYIAPFDRAVRGTLLGGSIEPAASDYRLMNVEMRTRETTIGGSFIAEAYRNFGMVGVAVIPALLGLLLGYFDRRHPSVVGDAVIGLVLVALLQHVRNAFTPVPFQIIFGLIIVGAVCAISKNLAQRPRSVRRSSALGRPR